MRYLASPVGPYEEVVGAVVTGRGVACVPFLAVDSPLSAAGGRSGWALPKTLASWSRDASQVTVTGQGWRVATRASDRGPGLPLAGRVRLAQADALGRVVTSRATAWGRGRAARVQVQVASDLGDQPGSVAGWLRSGPAPGLVLRGTLLVGRARSQERR